MFFGSMFFFSFLLVMNEVLLATLNVNGARDVRKRTIIYEVIKQKNIDVTFLQETHSDLKNAVDWAREFDGTPVLSHNTSVSGGVAILFAKNFSPVSYEVDEIVKGRLLKVRAIFERYALNFICVYVPTTPFERVFFWTYSVQL